jgi:hypothetical protein
VSPLATALVAAVVGVGIAVTMALQGDVAPGLVAGALGGVLVFILVRRVEEHNAMRRRELEKRGGTRRED